jgi:hypothetical protein
MSQSVYLLVLAKGPTEAWYRLSKEERDKLWLKVLDVDQQAGAKWHISCDSRWADEETYNWSVIEYPSMEAYQKKVEELEKLEWWRYFSAKTILGKLAE